MLINPPCPYRYRNNEAPRGQSQAENDVREKYPVQRGGAGGRGAARDRARRPRMVAAGRAAGAGDAGPGGARAVAEAYGSGEVFSSERVVGAKVVWPYIHTRTSGVGRRPEAGRGHL